MVEQQQASTRKKKKHEKWKSQLLRWWLVTTSVSSRFCCCCCCSVSPSGWASIEWLYVSKEKMLMQCIQSQNVESSEVFTSGACTVFYGKEIFKCHSINYLFARCLDVRLVFGPDSFEESGVLHFAPPPRSSPLVEVVFRWKKNIHFAMFDESRLIGSSSHSSQASKKASNIANRNGTWSCAMHSRCRSFNGVIFIEIEK